MSLYGELTPDDLERLREAVDWYDELSPFRIEEPRRFNAIAVLAETARRVLEVDREAAYEVAKRRLGTRRQITVDEIIDAALRLEGDQP